MNIFSEDITIDMESYKRTPLGYIPEEWRTCNIGETGEFFGGYAFKSKNFLSDSTDNSMQVLKMGNVKMGRLDLDNNPAYLSTGKLSEGTKRYILQEGDILISLTGTIGKTDYGNVGLVDKNNQYLLNQRVACFRDKSKFKKSFYYYYMQSALFRNRFFLLGVGGTGNQANVSVKELNNLQVVSPPLAEQQKITSILSTWDKAIELKEKLIEQKKEQKKGLMQKLLMGEVRLPGFEGEWKEVRLEKVVKRTKGKALKFIDGGKYPAIDMDYLETGTFKNFSDDATIFAKKTDVLLLWDGSRAGKTFTGVEGSVGSTFVKLECKGINNIFLQKQMEMNEEKIQNLREGSGIPHVPKDFLHYYKVKFPSEEEQEKIAEILEGIDKQILLLEKNRECLQEQKKGLMQKLLTGKVRVKV